MNATTTLTQDLPSSLDRRVRRTRHRQQGSAHHSAALVSEPIVAVTAVPARPSIGMSGNRFVKSVVAAVRRAAGPPSARPKRGDYPKHYSYIEHACMSREMDRL